MRYWRGRLGIVFALLLFTAPASFAVEYKWKDESGVVKSLADYKGKSVVLHFWASWCPPCLAEMPELEAWSRVNSGVELIVISLDRNIANAAAFLNSRKIDFPALQGSPSDTQRLGIRGLPTTMVIGPDSKIRKVRIGVVRWNHEAGGGAILEALR